MLQELLNIEYFLKEKKVFDIVKSEQVDYTDKMFVGSILSVLHKKSVIEQLKSLCKKNNTVNFVQQTEGWSVIDMGSIVVHLFMPATRKLYNIEEIYEFKKI